MRPTHLKQLSALTMAVLALPAAQAAADNDITTHFSGYGTVATTMTDRAASEFRESSAQFSGAKTQPDVGLTSRLGLQGVVRFGPQFSLTVQALAMRRGDKDFDVGTEWMYGQFTPVNGVDLRLGRVVLPAFLVSDSRFVGYASTWLRAPVEIYSSMPYSSLDGVQALWSESVAGAVVSTQISQGKTSSTLATGQFGTLPFKADSVMNASLGVEWQDWTARVSQTRISVPKPFLNVPNMPAPLAQHTIKDKFLNVGLQYDNGQAIVMAEWVRRTENKVVGYGRPFSATTGWYAAGGWRFGSVTPMLRYVRHRDDGGLNGFPKQTSLGASVRYELVRNVALKAQIDRYDATSTTAFVQPVPPLTRTGTKVNVLSVGADFVF